MSDINDNASAALDEELEVDSLLGEAADQASDYLDDSSESDDEPVTPPQSRPLNAEIAFDSPDQDTQETIDQRIAQEEPESGSAYGKPESGVDLRREAEDLNEQAPVDADESADEPAEVSAEESAMHIVQE